MLARLEIGVFGFSTIFVMWALLVRHHDAEALIVLDLFGPDNTVSLGVFTIDKSASNSVSTKMTITGSVHVRAREIYPPAVPSSNFCR